ncbi:regulatory protein RecX [Altericroceibacterium spongiae]|nr:RecX family transcriptional regulator [Altericroceibacterium spongiae]
MALAYVARFATSAAKLEAYLNRKLRECGWDEDTAPQPDVRALVERYVALGYVDDETYARARANSLLRRGYGRRRITQALGAAGIDEEIQEAVSASPSEQRRAILAMARKKRFGPFGHESPDAARREKQLASLLRAGHSLDNAREMVNAESIEWAEQWATELDHEQE